jgi:hypothetical protein
LTSSVGLCPSVHVLGQAEAAAKPVVENRALNSSYLIEDRRRMLHIQQQCKSHEWWDAAAVVGHTKTGDLSADMGPKQLMRSRSHNGQSYQTSPHAEHGEIACM